MPERLSFQQELFADSKELATQHARFRGRSGAFVDNMMLPVHRWYRYSAGFSADWVRSLLGERFPNSDDLTVLDPFAGVGTTLVACESEGVRSIGFEAHPFVSRIASAKLGGLRASPAELEKVYDQFMTRLERHTPSLNENLPALLDKCYAPESLQILLSMRELFLSGFDTRTRESELLWLTITSILRITSSAGTAQWQYVLPKKTKLNARSPVQAFSAKAEEILHDLDYAHRNGWGNMGTVLQTDARSPVVPDGLMVDTVITSPPYPNNYDYADATRLEMSFWGDVSGWGDLQSVVRRHLIRSCSQHTASEKLVLREVLEEPVLQPILKELEPVCFELEAVRMTRGGRKSYHTMAAAYFRDLGLVFRAMRKLCKSGSTMCFVIGDAAPYGVYMPADRWLGELALAAGFKSYNFEKIRDRNIKWKNRKHRVPLKEGRLWIEG